jgi:hypothetical protein
MSSYGSKELVEIKKVSFAVFLAEDRNRLLTPKTTQKLKQ